MHKLLKTETVPITQEYVSYFSSLPTTSGDRDRRSKKGKRQIAGLLSKLRDEIFHTPKWAVAVLDGKTYRVNGGHSSLMLEELNGDFPGGMVAIVDTFECDSRADIADLFRQFDPKASARSKLQEVNAAKAVYAALSDVSPTNVNRAADGVARYQRYILGQRLNDDDKIRLVHEHTKFILFADEFMQVPFMVKIGARVALFETHRQSPSLAWKFWTEVKDESNSKPGSGSRKLTAFLRKVHKPQSPKENLLGSLECVYAKCIHAANQFKHGGSTQLSFHPKAGAPKLLW